MQFMGYYEIQEGARKSLGWEAEKDFMSYHYEQQSQSNTRLINQKNKQTSVSVLPIPKSVETSPVRKNEGQAILNTSTD